MRTKNSFVTEISVLFLLLSSLACINRTTSGTLIPPVFVVMNHVSKQNGINTLKKEKNIDRVTA